MNRIEKIALAIGALLCAALVIGAATHHLPLNLTEVWGFVSGAAGVYLTVKRSLWNFPVGLVNNIFFGVLFFQARLFNDFGLQIVYFALGAWGWMVWLRGNTENEALPIGRAKKTDWLGCALFIIVATPLMMAISHHFGGATPFWDALTTALSLAAQYLLGRKFLENWALWLLADIIYVPLYLSRGLQLTSALYFGFGGLCVMGFLAWKREWIHEQSQNRRHHRQISAAASGP